MDIAYSDGIDWYFGTDGSTPFSQYDFVSVVMHEIAHGLNFAGSMRVSSGREAGDRAPAILSSMTASRKMAMASACSTPVPIPIRPSRWPTHSPGRWGVSFLTA